jgi:hypothetical protein
MHVNHARLRGAFVLLFNFQLASILRKGSYADRYFLVVCIGFAILIDLML